MAALLGSHPWISELLGILPLSALLDFVDMDSKLHVFQLVGTVPLWNWPITPSGSQTLLSDKFKLKTDNDESREVPCHLDAYGASLHWKAMDGRHGDYYVVPNTETLRLCLAACPSSIVTNEHQGVGDEHPRYQQLEFITLNRPKSTSTYSSSGGLWNMLLGPWRGYTVRYIVWSTLGYALLMSKIVAAFLLGCPFGAAFLILVAASGLCIYLLHGNRPRTLLREPPGGKLLYNRMIVASENENSSSWKAFYGESTILNCLLNLPLQAQPAHFSVHGRLLRLCLRALILAQWTTAVAAAVLKDWNALFVSVWVIFSILTQAYILPPQHSAKLWMRKHARIEMKSYRITLSSRRSLLNTLLALNPDTPHLSNIGEEPHAAHGVNPMAWIDPILKAGKHRDRWEEASRKALTETNERFRCDEVASQGHNDNFWKSNDFQWQAEYKEKTDYWIRCVHEGLYMAAKLKQIAEISA